MSASSPTCDFDIKTVERPAPTLDGLGRAVLVAVLRSWVRDHELSDDDLLFRTRNSKRPTESNWGRALNERAESSGNVR